MSTITITDNRLTTFSQQNTDFDILHFNLSDQAALSKLNWQGLDQVATLDLLKKYQRLLRLNPDPNVAMALLGVPQVQGAPAPAPAGPQQPSSAAGIVLAPTSPSVPQPPTSGAAQASTSPPVQQLPTSGTAQITPQPSASGAAQATSGQATQQTPGALDSAQAIAAIPREQFVQQFAPVVGGTATAQQIHLDATTITAKTMLLWANVQNLVASPFFRAIQVNNVDNSISQFENLPNYQELFGSLDFCSCDECNSIFSPAAYLVDLLRMTDQYITTPNAATIAQNFKLDERRPDLAQIDLTCANTNDLVSYLDIVNNVLAIKAAESLQTTTSSQPDLTQAINTAYTTLSTATYPFNLPFNLPLEQIRSYLGQLNTSLATLYRTFNAPQEVIAREALGLSLEEYTLITTPRPAASDLSNVYGLTVSANNLGGLANQDMFLKQTGLARQDLQDLLTQNLSAKELSSATLPRAFYINQLLAAKQYLYLSTDGSNTIRNLNLATLDRLQRFIRLAGKLNWSFADLDWVLHSLQVSEIDANTIQSIAKVKQVQARCNLPLNILSSFWYDLKTIGVGAPGPSQAPFDLIFNNPQLLGGQAPYHPQYQDAHGQPLNPLYTTVPVLKTPDANSRIAAGLRVSLDDLAALVTAFGKSGQMDFTVQNLSILFRHSQLAALVRLPINQYLLLLRLTNKLQPVFAVDDLLYLFEIIDWLRTSGFSVYELDYILHGTASNYVASKYQDQNIPPFLQSLQALSVSPQPALTIRDITDWTSLLQQLNNPTQPGPGQRIWSLLATNMQQMIAQAVTGATMLTNQQMADVISALNTILQRPDFYQTSAFASLAVPQQARDLLQSGVILSQNELLKLNRLFLATAYPQAIAQSAIGQIDDEWKEKLIQQLATFVGSTTDRVGALMEVIARNLTTPTGIHSYIEVFLYQSQAVDSQTYIQQVLKALSGGLVFVEKLQLTSAEIDSVRTSPTSYGFPANFQQITIDNLRSLSTFKQLTFAFRDTQNQLIGYFAKPAPATLASITGWSEEQINEAATGHFQSMPLLLTSVDGLAMLKKVFDLSASLGVNISFHDQLLSLATQPAQANWTAYTGVADAVINTVKARYNDDNRAKVSDTLNAALNEEKRSALAGFVLWKLGLNNLRTLTEYLLIDVETTGCASISLIKQAILSVQMYLQRCRMNLESGVTAVNIPDAWWEWVLSYGTWQANRKVFLYPENYLDPGLRKSKSDLFQELESELLQSPITQESVEAAYHNYFEKFAELAKLKIAASYRCFVPQSGGQDALDTLFLFARTASEPATYCYRECRYPASSAPTWTPWSKIDVNISADYVSPVFAFNKLFVFWVEITQTRQSAVNNNQTQHTTVQKATIKYIFQTESKKWMQPQTLAKDVIIDVTSTDPTVPDFHIDTERLFWKKAYPLAITEADTQQEKIVVMFGDIPNLPSTSPVPPSSTPGQDADISQFDLQLYAAQQQGYLANQRGAQGYSSLLPAVTLSSDAATENKFLLLPQSDVAKASLTNGLSQARNDLAATSVSNLALFAGGYDSSSSGFSATVDIYNAATAQWSTSRLSQPRTTLTATSVGNLALFAGGEGANFMATSVVDIYNATTGQWSAAQLSQARQKFAATSVGNLALFAGGLNNAAAGNASDVVDIYNATTGQWSTARLSQARTTLAATSVGNLALFAGGESANGASDVVDIYNATSGQWSTAKLSQARAALTATSVGNLALFAGGGSTNGPSDVVDIYNATSGQWSAAKLSQARSGPAAASIGNLALFAGGFSATALSDVVDIYNATSGQWSTAKLSQARSDLAAASAGNLALFASGSNSRIVDTFLPIRATSSIIGVIEGTTFAAKTVDTALHANYIADSDRSLLDHLVDYWPLDEGAGTIIDDRAGSNNGLIAGGANWQAVTDFPGTAARSVLQFGAQGNYVTLPPGSLPTGSEITVSFWAFGGPSLPKMASIMEAAGGATNQRIFNIHLPWVDGNVYFDCGGDGSGNYDRAVMPVNAQDYKGKWSHWTFTKNAALGEMKIYLNGKLLHAETGKTKLLPAATFFILGADRGLTTNYDGKVADLHIWNVALSSEQILLLMPGSNPLLKSVSKQNACAQTVKNQADWSTFDNGDEAFLVIPQSDAPRPISDSLVMQNVGRDALELAYSDPSSTALTNPRFAFTRLTTSTIRQLSQKVLIGGIDELLTLDSQMTPEPDFARFLPSSVVLPPAKSTLDFSGPYGLYFQEIFFYIPFLVANMLNTNQQFAQAQRWYHYIFNPTQQPENSQGQPGDRYWRYLPFRGNTLQKLQDLLQDNQAISAYNNDPFDPDAIAQLRIGAYQKTVVMKYIDNLLDWGDALFTQDTWESITQATLVYLLAYDLLGPRPQSVGPCPAPAPQKFANIKAYYKGGNIPQFLIELEQHVKNGSISATVNPPFNAINAYFCVSENDQFIAYWDRVEDRLYKIRHCQNIAGTIRQLALFEPPLNPADLVRAAAGNVPISVVAGLTAEVPQYRFDYLLDRAKNISSALIELGSTLLNTLEKKDAEQLSVLRATQEATIAQLLQTTRQQQIDEANASLDALNKSLVAAQHRVDYYQSLISGGLSTYEHDAQSRQGDVLPYQQAAIGLNTAAAILFFLPTIFGLADGGAEPGWAITTAASVLDGYTAYLNQQASLATTMGQYERRTQEWQQQLQVAQDDVATLNQQIATAQITAAIATSELATQQKSIEQTNEIEDFLQRKFSNQDLYQWMINRVSALYFQAFKLALDRALAVQKAYQYELNSDDTYIRFDYWDSLRQGLLAGEGLLFGLNQLEKAYHDGNSRRLEIEKTISLLQLDPKAFLDLKNTGKCQFQLSEKLFDYDFPGHYCRQIKTIDLSIPAVVGPYQNIKATLTQLSDRVLVQADQNAVTYLLAGQGTMPDASTLRSGWRRNQKVALSRGVNDNGMFELNFRDERYLPFEGTGAVSTWELRLPKATNRIDFESLSDVIIHLSYTALDAGDGPFTQQVQNVLQNYEGAYYLNLKQGFPGAWHNFLSMPTNQMSQQLKVSISSQIIPPHLMNVNLLNVYWKLDVPDGTIPSGATFLSVQIGNGNATTVSLNSNIATLPVNLSPDQFVADWTISVDLTKVPSALLKNGSLDPAVFQNIECIFFYQGEIDWSA